MKLTITTQRSFGPLPLRSQAKVELLASSEGLGYMIVFGRQLFQLDVVMAAVVVVGAVGYVLDRVLARIEIVLLGWRRTGF